MTSVTTRYDPKLIFSELGELLMDQELRMNARNTVSRNLESGELNVVTKTNAGSKYDVRCQICLRKGHGAIDCYNRINLSKFPPNHSRTLSVSGPSGSIGGKRGSVNSVAHNISEVMTMWYPDLGATFYLQTQMRISSNLVHTRVRIVCLQQIELHC